MFVLVGIAAFVDSKVRQNDYFTVKPLLVSMFQVLDLSSDVFFTLRIRKEIERISAVIIFSNDIQEDLFLIIFLLSATFIVVPILVSIFQLMKEIQTYWWRDDQVKRWLVEKSKILYIFSIFTGSSFTAVELLNSNLFQLNIFSMDLSKNQLIGFEAKKIYSIVLIEVKKFICFSQRF